MSSYFRFYKNIFVSFFWENGIKRHTHTHPGIEQWNPNWIVADENFIFGENFLIPIRMIEFNSNEKIFN